jgi:hypothetical protein
LPETNHTVREEVDGISITFSMNFEADLVQALAPTHDGGAYVLGGGRIWRIDDRGHARDIGTGPDQYSHLVVDERDELVALSTFDELRFFEPRDEAAKSLPMSGIHQVRWSDPRGLLAAFDETRLSLFDRTGTLVCEYEFTTQIGDALWDEDLLVIAASKAQIFDMGIVA